MLVTPSLVRQVARLARLDLTDDEVEGMTRELQRILGHVEALATVELGASAPAGDLGELSETAAVPPMACAELRADVPEDGLDRAREVVQNAPAVDTLGAFFLVPKVLGDGA